MDHNNSALTYIVTHDSVRYVIISSPFGVFSNNKDQKLLLQNGKIVPQNTSLAIAQMVKTIKTLQKAGKTPIIVSPPPKSGFNIGECLERSATGLMTFHHSGCEVTVGEYQDNQREIIDALTEVQIKTGVKIVWLNALLCDQDVCRTSIKKVGIYRDGGHLSYRGSELLLRNLKIL